MRILARVVIALCTLLLACGGDGQVDADRAALIERLATVGSVWNGQTGLGRATWTWTDTSVRLSVITEVTHDDLLYTTASGTYAVSDRQNDDGSFDVDVHFSQNGAWWAISSIGLDRLSSEDITVAILLDNYAVVIDGVRYTRITF